MGAASVQAARYATVSILDAVSVSLNMPQGHIYKADRGRGGGTSAHWQIGLAYASLRQIGEPIADRFTADTI
jgi:hypothetical protein